MDITKCSDSKCPVRGHCRRFTAESNNYYQSYFVDSPAEYEDDNFVTCKVFWGTEQESILNLLKDIANGNRH